MNWTTALFFFAGFCPAWVAYLTEIMAQSPQPEFTVLNWSLLIMKSMAGGVVSVIAYRQGVKTPTPPTTK